MAENERVEPTDVESAAGSRAELVASTLEALQARVEQTDREALRGALSFQRASGEDRAAPGDGAR